MTYKSEAVSKMLQENEEKKHDENASEIKAETISIISGPGVYKLDPSPSSYVIAVEGKMRLISHLPKKHVIKSEIFLKITKLRY